MLFKTPNLIFLVVLVMFCILFSPRTQHFHFGINKCYIDLLPEILLHCIDSYPQNYIRLGVFLLSLLDNICTLWVLQHMQLSHLYTYIAFNGFSIQCIYIINIFSVPCFKLNRSNLPADVAAIEDGCARFKHSRRFSQMKRFKNLRFRNEIASKIFKIIFFS